MAGSDRVRGRPRAVRAGGESRRVGAGGRAAGPPRQASSAGPGERVAAASGVALALLMLLDWFGGRNAWQLELMDLVLLGIAVFAVAVAVTGGAGGGTADRSPLALGLTVAGGVAVGAMLTLVVESSGGTVPLVASLGAAAGILVGGLLAMGATRRRGRNGPPPVSGGGRSPQ